jgi:uncharacterized membrane protein
MSERESARSVGQFFPTKKSIKMSEEVAVVMAEHAAKGAMKATSTACKGCSQSFKAVGKLLAKSKMVLVSLILCCFVGACIQLVLSIIGFPFYSIGLTIWRMLMDFFLLTVSGWALVASRTNAKGSLSWNGWFLIILGIVFLFNMFSDISDAGKNAITTAIILLDTIFFFLVILTGLALYERKAIIEAEEAKIAEEAAARKAAEYAQMSTKDKVTSFFGMKKSSDGAPAAAPAPAPVNSAKAPAVAPAPAPVNSAKK